MRAQLDEKVVIQANAQFWEQMLSMKLDRMPILAEFCVHPGHLIASVTLSGNWTGSIEVRMTKRLAKNATAAMLMQPVEEVGEADTLDATKEIANMIAGAIKSALPRPCSMAVPASAFDPEGFCGPACTEDSLIVAFRHLEGEMMVRVLEQECVV